MKKNNKLQINSDKIMKNEELITLRGGYDGEGCGYFLCGCYGVPEAWWNCYCSVEAMTNDLQTRCGGLGGVCSSAGSCY